MAMSDAQTRLARVVSTLLKGLQEAGQYRPCLLFCHHGHVRRTGAARIYASMPPIKALQGTGAETASILYIHCCCRELEFN
eukprot:1136707-Pelagomonas_calceolata.AAC.7